MIIKVDCKFLAGTFDKDACLLNSKEDKMVKCDGQCKECSNKDKKQ